MYRATPSMMTIVGQLLVDFNLLQQQIVTFDVGIDRDQMTNRQLLLRPRLWICKLGFYSKR